MKILKKSAWPKALRSAYDRAQMRIPWVLANRDKAERNAKKAAKEIAAARVALDSWHKLILKLPKDQQNAELSVYKKLDREWYATASAFYMDSVNKRTGKKTTKIAGYDEVGIAPIVVAGVILAIGAVAFAPAAYQVALSLRENATTKGRELDARIAASQGRQRPLQDSTMPDGKDGGGGAGIAVAAGVVVLALAGGVYVLARRS